MAILYIAVLLSILLAVHMIVVGMARSAVQAAADRAVTAAQSAGNGDCDGDPTLGYSARQCIGIFTAQWAMAASRGSVVLARPATVWVQPERGSVTVWVYGATTSPLAGRVEVVGRACGPLDDVLASQLVDVPADAWRC